MKPKRLQHRIFVYVLVPVFLLLAGIGWAGYIYTSNTVLDQWAETAVAKLQKTVHSMDMRLNKSRELLLMLNKNPDPHQISDIYPFIVEQLKRSNGVTGVNLNWYKRYGQKGVPENTRLKTGTLPGRYDRFEKLQVSKPYYHTDINAKAVLVFADFLNEQKKVVGQIRVTVTFDDLLKTTGKANWWKGNKAFLIDNNGNILSNLSNKKKFGNSNFESLTLKALKKYKYGTIFSTGHPPEKVSGYYRLRGTPWSLVIIAPGNQVFTSVLEFRFYYFFCGFLFIVCIIFFIKTVILNITQAIQRVSDAARDLANGIFGDPLPVQSNDEVGVLTRNFNKMTKQLKERIRLRKEMNLAMEVQQHLLPPAHFSYKNLSISGVTFYCEKTGGDFFDIFEAPGTKEKVFVMVGDAAGHGIEAALLMATTRGLLRSCINQESSLSQILNDVNSLLCIDTCNTAGSVSLFFMMIDMDKNEIRWINTGHGDAFIYNPGQQCVLRLKKTGAVPGVEQGSDYREIIQAHHPEGTIILIGTDGAGNVKNFENKKFGKEKIKQILKQNCHFSPKNIIRAIVSEILEFKGGCTQNDDITLVAVKF